jgi:hypothetical protein
MTTDEARQLADRLGGKMTNYPNAVDAARVLREQADEIDRLEALVAALLALPDEMEPVSHDPDHPSDKSFPVWGQTTLRNRMRQIEQWLLDTADEVGA